MLFSDVHAGLTLRLARKGAKRPVYVEVVCDSGVTPRLSLQEWVSAVMAVYGLPCLKGGEDIVTYSARVQGSVIERANVHAASVRSAAERGIKGRG